MSNEPNIRNRVAGAVVLVSLAVILLPLILDGKKKNQIIESYIPDKPKSGEIILVNVEQSLKQDQTEEIKKQTDESKKKSITIDAKEIVADTASNTKTVKEPDTKDEPIDQIQKAAEKVVVNKPEPKRQNRPTYQQAGFLVQLGSFGSRENADNLVAQLNTGGFRAYSKRGTSAGKTIYRVFAGPYLERTKAESDMAKMKKMAAINPMVVTYDPIKHARG